MKAELESGQNHDSDHLPKKIQNQNWDLGRKGRKLREINKKKQSLRKKSKYKKASKVILKTYPIVVDPRIISR